MLHAEFSFVARVSNIRHGYLFKSCFIYSHHSYYKWRSQIRETVAWFRGTFGVIAKDLADTNREIQRERAKKRNAFQWEKQTMKKAIISSGISAGGIF